MADADKMREERDFAAKVAKQAKCRHREVYSSSVTTYAGHFTNKYCFDCGKTWRWEDPLAPVTNGERL